MINSDNLARRSKGKGSINNWEIEMIQLILYDLNNSDNWTEETQDNFREKKPLIWCTSLFNKQVRMIRDKIRASMNKIENIEIKIDTVRSFSGDEADVVIWSLTRTPEINTRRQKLVYSLDALLNAEYIYNMITRTRSKIFIIGSKFVLTQLGNILQNWRQIWNQAFYQRIGNLISNIISGSLPGVTILEA